MNVKWGFLVFSASRAWPNSISFSHRVLHVIIAEACRTKSSTSYPLLDPTRTLLQQEKGI